MSEPDFNDVVEVICKEDPRYDRKAYTFVNEGLAQTVKSQRSKGRATKAPSQHVTAQELLEGLRAHALDQFGPLTQTVLHAWGVRACADFGEIVFNLIEYGKFKKSDTDRREDFAVAYEFEDAFVKPFLPRESRHSRPASSAKAEQA